MGVSATKNTSSKQQVRSKIPTINAVQVFSPELHPIVFLGFFLILGASENVCYSFSWLQCVKQEFTVFVSSKNQTTCTFFLQLITFNSNWSINSPGETVADVVLEVSENSHSNVSSEVLSKVVAYQHGVC